MKVTIGHACGGGAACRGPLTVFLMGWVLGGAVLDNGEHPRVGDEGEAFALDVLVVGSVSPG